MHEINGDWYPWGGMVNSNTPALFKRAGGASARRLRASRARRTCAGSGRRCPRRAARRRPPLRALLPGQRYVDVLALDGYNYGASFPHFGGWRSFRAIFANAYRRVTGLGPQPVWIAEVGSAANGGSKAAWVRDMFRSARRMRRLEAIVWMDTVSPQEGDWRARLPLGVAPAFRESGRGSSGRGPLKIKKPARVGGQASVRWTAMNAAEAVHRWRVYLNGRRLRTLSSQARILHKRIVRKGHYRWTVRGYDVQGEQVASASGAFRV